VVSRWLSSSEFDSLKVAKSESFDRQNSGHECGKIRVLGTRILREGEDAGFDAGDGNGFETIRYNSNQL